MWRSGCRSFDWQADDEARVAGLGLDVKLSGELLGDDAVNDLEAEAGAGSLRLSGEERLEDARKNIGWNPGAVIDDRDNKPIGLGPSGDFEFPALRGGVDGVVDEIGPDLAESVAFCANG